VTSRLPARVHIEPSRVSSPRADLHLAVSAGGRAPAVRRAAAGEHTPGPALVRRIARLIRRLRGGGGAGSVAGMKNSRSLWYVLAISYTSEDSRRIEELLCQPMAGPALNQSLRPWFLSVEAVVKRIERGDTFKTYKSEWSMEGPDVGVVEPEDGPKFVRTGGNTTSVDDLESLPVYVNRPAPVVVTRLMAGATKQQRSAEAPGRAARGAVC
jgi:hypothetical protein